MLVRLHMAHLFACRRMAVSGERLMAAAIKGVFSLLVAYYLYTMAFNNLLFNGHHTPDSVIYVNMASVIVQGGGMAITAAPLDMAVEENLALPMPVSSYAPGYPLLLALGSVMGIKITAFALLVSGICLGVLITCAYLVTRTVLGSEGGLVAVALLSNFDPLVDASRHIWSETMGIGLALASLTFLLHVLKRRQRDHFLLPLLFLSGLLAGSAFTTRYALLPLGVLAVLTLLERDCRRSLWSITSFAVGHLTVSGALVARNLSLPAHGTSVPPRDMAFGTIFSDLYQVIIDLLTPGSGWSTLILFVLIAASLIAGAKVLFRKRFVTLLLPLRLALPLILWPAIYLMFLIYAERVQHIDPINMRLTLPATVVLVMLVGGFVGRLTILPRVAVQTLAVIVLIHPCLEEMQTAKTIGRIHAAKRGLFDGPRMPKEIEFLVSVVEENDLVIAEKGLFIPFFAGPVKTLYFMDTPRVSAKRLGEYLAKGGYGKIFVVLRPGPTEEHMVQLKAFFSEGIGHELNLKFASESGVVF